MFVRSATEEEDCSWLMNLCDSFEVKSLQNDL